VPLSETLINVLLLTVILGGSALITQWFTRKAYNRCSKCGGLNAKRRSSVLAEIRCVRADCPLKRREATAVAKRQVVPDIRGRARGRQRTIFGKSFDATHVCVLALLMVSLVSPQFKPSGILGKESRCDPT
jgi:hypothetical protein